MNQFFERRYVIAGIFITIIFILIARLYYMQIVDDKYLLYANNNVIRTITKFADRGPILDRNGKILVGNELVYDISVIPKQVKPFDTMAFCKLIGMDKAEFDKRFLKAKIQSPNREIIFDKQLSPQLYASLQERLSEFQGFFVDPHPVRAYPDSVAAQFLGYIGEVQPKDIAKSGGYYRLGDYIGATGVEKAYEHILRGQKGVTNMMVDSRGVAKGSYANGAYDTIPIPGARLKSSLDIDIQKLGEKLMQNKVGSIVAIEPSTGEILCFVSSPTYDPNLMVGRNRGNNADSLNKDPYKPFFIRPIGAHYPPGSSFKPLSALIALQEGVITPQTTYYCPGYYISGNRRIKCLEKHGLVSLSSAVAGSCNGYFSMVFEKLMNVSGYKNISPTFTDWRTNVNKFGLGSKLGLDMPNEKGGNLPTALVYDKIYHKCGWRSSTIISLAIGQGEVEATPLQLANIECTIANHGFYYTPHLIKSVGTKNMIRPEDTVKKYVGIDAKYFEPVIDGMQAVVENGTAIRSKIPGIVMCGKTGTAQNPHGEDHSVFVAFAPRDTPRIAIAVVVENSGEGAHWAAPIASFIVEKYLKGSISKRETGITPEYFMEANRLPEINNYSHKPKGKPSPADSVKNIKKNTDQPKVKSVFHKNKKDTVKFLAVNKGK
ncbi:MAG: spoVD [Mucilaginibacter sp.]|nr:spoVD [Mucilaginibacter sp.]